MPLCYSLVSFVNCIHIKLREAVKRLCLVKTIGTTFPSECKHKFAVETAFSIGSIYLLPFYKQWRRTIAVSFTFS